MTYIYLAYGREDIIRQAIFSVASLLRFHPKQVAIYTDQPSRFADFTRMSEALVIVPMNNEMIESWRGEVQFALRAKIKVLEDAFERFGGPIVFLDADTIIQKDPQELFSRLQGQNTLMHALETVVEDGKDLLTKKIAKFLRKRNLQVDGKPFDIDASVTMYNSGVIGLGDQNKKWLPEILKLSDALYSAYPKHVMEQLAISYYFQKFTKLQTCEDFVLHYWPQKDLYQASLDVFLQKFPSGKEVFDNFDKFTLLAELPRPKSPKLFRILSRPFEFLSR